MYSNANRLDAFACYKKIQFSPEDQERIITTDWEEIINRDDLFGGRADLKRLHAAIAHHRLDVYHESISHEIPSEIVLVRCNRPRSGQTPYQQVRGATERLNWFSPYAFSKGADGKKLKNAHLGLLFPLLAYVISSKQMHRDLYVQAMNSETDSVSITDTGTSLYVGTSPIGVDYGESRKNRIPRLALHPPKSQFRASLTLVDPDAVRSSRLWMIPARGN